MPVFGDHLPWLLPVAFAASLMASVAGTGAGVILLPALVTVLGVREAVPAYAVALLIANASRVILYRRHIDFHVVGWFCAGALPMAVLGAWLFTRVPEVGLLRLLGGFLVLAVVVRHLRPKRSGGFRASGFAPVGAVFSLVSAIVGSAGPFLAPFYLAFGLTRGAFVGTEALGTAVTHVCKLAAYQGLGVLPASVWWAGLALGPVMVLGALAGRQVVEKLSAQAFTWVIDAILLGFGVGFLLV